MTDVGDLSRFGFRIGPPTESPDVVDVSIFMGGTNVSLHDSSAYLPSYVGALELQSRELKRRLNFERYAKAFLPFNLSQIHNMLLHGEPNVFSDEEELEYVANFHRFMQLNEPNTDPLAAFLLPANNGTLALTYQYDPGGAGYQRHDIVDGVSDILPYELIHTIEWAIAILTSNGTIRP